MNDFDDEFGQPSCSLRNDQNVPGRRAKLTHLPCLGWRGFKEILIIDRLESCYFELLQFFGCFHCRCNAICVVLKTNRGVTRCLRCLRVQLDLSGSSRHGHHLEKSWVALYKQISISIKDSSRISQSQPFVWPCSSTPFDPNVCKQHRAPSHIISSFTPNIA